VRRGPNAPPEPPYDVTAWSLGMLLGVDTVFVSNPLPAFKMTRVDGLPKVGGDVSGSGSRFAFDYKGPDTAIAINRLLKDGARVAFDGPSHVSVAGVSRGKVEQVAKDFGLVVKVSDPGRTKDQGRTRDQERTKDQGPGTKDQPFHAPRVAMYQPWTGGNMDEGWTRWVLEQYEFNLTSIHNADIRAGRLRQKFDAIIIADQAAREIIDGYEAPSIRPEYRGGIGEAGLEQLKQFVADGGTLVTMGNACDLAIEKLPIPVRNLKKGLTRDQHFAPGAILKLEVDTQHPIGYGTPSDLNDSVILNSNADWIAPGTRISATTSCGNGTPRWSVTRPVITASRARRISTLSATGIGFVAKPVLAAVTARDPGTPVITNRPSASVRTGRRSSPGTNPMRALRSGSPVSSATTRP